MNRLFAITTLVILSAACSDGDKRAPGSGLSDGGTTYTPTSTTQQFIDQLLDAECAFGLRCGTFPDKSTCLDLYRSIISVGSLTYSIDQGRATLNPSLLPACLHAISNLPCSLNLSLPSPLEEPCKSVVVGTLGSGDDCVDKSECKPGLECSKGSCTGSCCAGVCVPTKPLASVGGSCSGSSKLSCVASAYCKQAYNTTTKKYEGTCQPRVSVGAPCIDYDSCADNAQCVVTLGSRTCVPPAKDGAPCGTIGPTCENSGSYCDLGKGTCQPRLKDNVPCGLPDAGMVSPLTAGCLSFSQCKNGICTRLPVVGQACSKTDASAYNECLMVGTCVDGVCQTRSPTAVCTVAVAKANAADAGTSR